MIHQVYRNCFFKNPAQIVFTFHLHILENNSRFEEDDPQNLKKIAKIIENLSPGVGPAIAKVRLHATRPTSDPKKGSSFARSLGIMDPKKKGTRMKENIIQPVIPRGFSC